jgi:hypothetical protein
VCTLTGDRQVGGPQHRVGPPLPQPLLPDKKERKLSVGFSMKRPKKYILLDLFRTSIVHPDIL